MTKPVEDYGFQRVKISRAGRVLTLALSRPGAMNSVDLLMHEELAELFEAAKRDPDSDIIILTGEGDAFSAGGDIAWFKEIYEGRAHGPTTEDAKRIVFSLLDLDKPIIAKVRGPCVGLGCTLALFCDVIFAGSTARFADPHVRAGIVAGDGGPVIWPQLVGFARAKEYLMTGDPVDAQAAADMGLVNHLVADEELDAAVDAFAQRLARGPQLAIRYTKIATNIELKRIATQAMDAALAYEMLTFASADHREAVEAFLGKRKPAFTGR